MFKTRIINIESISTQQFIIPTYQRPYVWGLEQIEKLIKDCAYAFASNRNEAYFIGSVLTDDKTNFSELIDGQQRFTTLWLIAVVYHKKNIKSLLINFLKTGEDLRLGFEIRKEVKEYFELLVNHPLDAINKYNEEELESKPYLENITKGVATIEGILDTLKDPLTQNNIDLIAFGNYIYNKVMMVENTAPQNVDLNKLFATINNSGIQLEQSDIVKAKLLNKIKTKKVLYSKIWECCENMNDYFERNIRKVFVATNWNKIEEKDFVLFDENKFIYESSDTILKNKPYTIEEIFHDLLNVQSIDKKSEIEEKNQEIYCRSVINFSQLLLHTYRIHLYINDKPDFVGPFHTNRLIRIFQELANSSESEIIHFIELLWEVRYVFDKNIIKWITDTDTKEEHLELTTINKSISKGNTYFNRNIIEKSEQLMLQSVLYFTGDYLRQYWLTPYLYNLLSTEEDSSTENAIEKLEDIDNQLSLSLKSDKEASFLVINENLKVDFDFEEYLSEFKGTSFRHYWFQKLEYILYKNWGNRSDEKFKKFRITSKNSVEHIYPQNPEFKKKLDHKYSNNFGNLVLLSVSQNSEYSRKDVNVKREEFFNKNGYDSLKSFYIFSKYKNERDEESIIRHSEKMIKKMIEHYR